MKLKRVLYVNMKVHIPLHRHYTVYNVTTIDGRL